MKTFMPKKGPKGGKGSKPASAGPQDDRWFVVDADGKTLGRLATSVARVLMGKNRPDFTPHADLGDHVIVVNAARVQLTGTKWKDKVYSRHTGYPGGLKQEHASEVLERAPEELVQSAVSGMLPKSKLGKGMLRKLKVYRGAEHPHQAQLPQPL